jgi:hypothetical protein
MPASNERFPSVPQIRPFLREKLCGTDGRGLKFPLPPSVPGEPGTNTERTGTDGNGRSGLGGVAYLAPDCCDVLREVEKQSKEIKA